MQEKEQVDGQGHGHVLNSQEERVHSAELHLVGRAVNTSH